MFAVFLVADGVVVVDDGDGVLSRATQQHIEEMPAFFGVVEMMVLDEDLPDAEPAVHELAVGLHERSSRSCCPLPSR